MSINSVLLEELEVLKSIYMDDLEMLQGDEESLELAMKLHPSTADDVDKKYVCLTLHLFIPYQYPAKLPEITIKNPRGLSDAHLVSIEENLYALSASKTGESMLYELFEYGKDSLTDNNRPNCVCPICLELFKDSDKFFRTSCYHFFHNTCIRGYVQACAESEEKNCPVCRKNINIDSALSETVEVDEHNASDFIPFVPDKKYRIWKENCRKLFEQQRKKGGIIDLEFEKNKYLIHMADTPARLYSEENDRNEIVSVCSADTQDIQCNIVLNKAVLKKDGEKKWEPQQTTSKHKSHVHISHKNAHFSHYKPKHGTLNKNNSSKQSHRSLPKPFVPKDRKEIDNGMKTFKGDMSSHTVKSHRENVIDTRPKIVKEEMPSKRFNKLTRGTLSDDKDVIVKKTMCTERKTVRPPAGFTTENNQKAIPNVKPPPGFPPLL